MTPVGRLTIERIGCAFYCATITRGGREVSQGEARGRAAAAALALGRAGVDRAALRRLVGTLGGQI